jgi:hypothetical protein
MRREALTIRAEVRPPANTDRRDRRPQVHSWPSDGRRDFTALTVALAANLAGQPEQVREQAYRLINAAVEGQFDLDTGD